MNTIVKLKGNQSVDLDILHEIFHENTKHDSSRGLEVRQRIGNYLTAEQSIRETAAAYKVYRLLPQIDLPMAQASTMPLFTALADRVSVRNFQRKPVSLQALSNLLFHALACNREASSTLFADVLLRFRSYPSGGGLYPIEIYPVLLNVEGAPRAITHYDPVNHRLELLTENLYFKELDRSFLGDSALVNSAAFAVIFTAVFERSTVKYGDRGYRLCLLEAGHAAQNVCLTATTQSLGTLPHGGFDDNTLARLLGVDGLNEAVVHVVFGGVPASVNDVNPVNDRSLQSS